jgi:predicted amidohydrolase
MHDFEFNPNIGRTVRLLSLSFDGLNLSEVEALIREECREGTDLILLPESWTGPEGFETLEGPTFRAMAEASRQRRAYLLCTLPHLDEGYRYTSAVLFDRQGQVAGIYNKTFPYWNELTLEPPVSPGEAAPVWQTDFGRLGAAVCFDMNFPEMWQQLADQEAELVAWSSAVSGGMSLQAQAIQHHFYIFTANLSGDCTLFDISGEVALYEPPQRVHACRATIDLDRGIYHYNFNLDKLDRLLAERGEDVEVERWLPKEEWFVLKACRPGVSARQLAKQYGLEELRDYIRRSRVEIDRRRGGKLPFRVDPKE